MADELACQITGRSLPRQLPADLDVAQTQVVERHHDDEPLGVRTEQLLPQRAVSDRSRHLEHDPRRAGPDGGVDDAGVRGQPQRRRPQVRTVSKPEIRVVDNDERRVRRAGCRVAGFGHRRLRAGAVQTQELLDSPDAAVVVAPTARKLRPDRVGMVGPRIALSSRSCDHRWATHLHR